MGFWYLLLLLTGVVVFIVGVIKIKTAREGSKAFIPLVTGGILIALSVFLLTPNSSEIIANLLNLQ